MLKRKLFFIITALASVIISGCSKQQLDYEKIEPEKKVETTERPAGKYGVFAEGGTIVNGTGSRAENGLPGSSAPVINYPGGQLVGCGWYATKERPRIYANPNPGYEVEYCYGAETQSRDPRQYDYAVKGNGIEVPIENDDVVFKVKFRPSTENLNLTIQQMPGGRVIVIRHKYIRSRYVVIARPDDDHEFISYSKISGDADIHDSRSERTLVSLGSTNSIIKPSFVWVGSVHHIYLKYDIHPSYGSYGYFLEADHAVNHDLSVMLDCRPNISSYGPYGGTEVQNFSFHHKLTLGKGNRYSDLLDPDSHPYMRLLPRQYWDIKLLYRSWKDDEKLIYNGTEYQYILHSDLPLSGDYREGRF